MSNYIVANRPRNQPPQLLLDISDLVRSDHGTGIQRVVRSIMGQLLTDDACSFRVEPVYYSNGRYVYARRFTQKFLDCAAVAFEDDPIAIGPGDIFLGLDLSMDTVTEATEVLRAFQAQGGYVCFVVYDILPLLRPDWWPPPFVETFSGWFTSIATLSDKLICISRATAEDVRNWLGKKQTGRATPLAISYFHLGADFAVSSATTGMPADSADVMAAVALRPTFLCVGTIEPRKGHAQLLAGFDLLWARGIEANLVIIGKGGWMVDHLLERLRRHPQLGTQLFWLAGISDEYLHKLYPVSTALIAASEGEGFGLPLIEAARFHVPIIARDLPVFREVAEDGAYYFSGTTPEDLAAAITGWMQLNAACEAPMGSRICWLTWRESAAELLEALVEPDVHHHDARIEIASSATENSQKFEVQTAVEVERSKVVQQPAVAKAEMVVLRDSLARRESDCARFQEQTAASASRVARLRESLPQRESDDGRFQERAATARAEALRQMLAGREADYQRLRVSAAEASAVLARTAEERDKFGVQQRRWLAAALPNPEDKLNVRARYRLQSQLYERGWLRWLARGLMRHARMLTAVADRARDKGRWEFAARFYQEALELAPARPPIWVQYGHALKESGNLAAAESAYRKSLELNRDTADTHLQLGHVLKLQGWLDEAGYAYLCALILRPDSRPPLDELIALGWTPEGIEKALSQARLKH
jgi:glycosyltransferase involved in cell wall biosynthesis